MTTNKDSIKCTSWKKKRGFWAALEDDVVVPLKMPGSKDLIRDDKIRLDPIR